MKNNGLIFFDILIVKGIVKVFNGKDYVSIMNLFLKYNFKEVRVYWDKVKKELGKNEVIFLMNIEDILDVKIFVEYIKL